MTGSNLRSAWRTYVRKFGFVRTLRRQRLDPAMAGKMARTSMYAVTVKDAFYLDNRHGFGQRVAVFRSSMKPRT